MIGRGSNIVRDGLVFCMDAADSRCYNPDVGGSTIVDLASGINCSKTSSVTWESTKKGCFDFPNSNTEYITVLNNGNGSVFDTQEFTIEFWAFFQNEGSYDMLWSFDYTSHTPPYYAQHFRMNGSSNDLELYAISNRNGSYNNSEAAWTTGNALTDETWHHLVMTREDGSTKLYINGVLVANETYTSGDITYYNQEVWIGHSNFSNGALGGKIAACNFYNRALNNDEILTNFAAKRKRFGV